MREFSNRPPETIQDVQEVLQYPRVSFLQMMECVEVCRKQKEWVLRRQASRKALSLAVGSEHPEIGSVSQAATIVANCFLSEAKTLSQVPKLAEEAHSYLAHRHADETNPVLRVAFSEAERDFAEFVLLVDSSDVISRIKLSSALRKKRERPDLAVEAADLALKEEPSNLAAMVTKGAALCDLERFGDSIDILQQALSIAPEDTFALITLSRAMQENSQVGVSLKLARKAFDLNPESREAARRLLAAAVASSNASDIAEARMLLDEVAIARGDDTKWNVLLAAEIYREEGKLSEALELLKEAKAGTSGILAKRISKLMSEIRSALVNRQERFSFDETRGDTSEG